MAEPTITIEEAMALLDKHAAEAKAKKKKKDDTKEKVKAIMVKGADQGRAGLGVHTKNLLDQVDD
jgi:topoisomerase IA-like protein